GGQRNVYQHAQQLAVEPYCSACTLEGRPVGGGLCRQSELALGDSFRCQRRCTGRSSHLFPVPECLQQSKHYVQALWCDESRIYDLFYAQRAIQLPQSANFLSV